MHLTHLLLRQFRNIHSLELEPGQNLNCFVGSNAQGKTSLIESLYFLSALKSFRTKKNQDLIQMGTEAFQAEARFFFKKELPPLQTKVHQQKEKRTLWIDEKMVSSSKFVGKLKTVVFSPESLASIKGGPELRRDLIDQAVFQIFSDEGAEAQRAFTRSLRQRNACLKQMKEGSLPLGKGRMILESLDEGFCRWAGLVTFYRLRFLDEILPTLSDVYSKITSTSHQVGFSYLSGEKSWTERQKIDIESRIKQEIHHPTRRVTEETLGVTLTGPHRHEVSFLFNGNDSRIYCSQGQQRALILAFKIAEIVYHSRVFGSFPLLLLDDVLSEFDEQKKGFLVEFLRQNATQTFLTTTDTTPLLQGCSIFQMDEGRLSVLGRR